MKQKKNVRWTAVLGGLFFTWVGFSAVARAAAPFTGARAIKSSYGAIFQIDSDSMGSMKKTLNNMENALHDPRLAGKIKIELIANSKGYEVYRKGNGLEKNLRHLLSEGVILAQCQNTLRELKVDPKTLYPFISIVPSGAGEVILREGQGWAYVHPS